MKLKIYQISKNEWLKFAYTYDCLNTYVTLGVFIIEQDSIDQYFYITDQSYPAVFSEGKRPHFFINMKPFNISDFIKIISTEEWIIKFFNSGLRGFYATSQFYEILISHTCDELADINISKIYKFLLGILKEEIEL